MSYIKIGFGLAQGLLTYALTKQSFFSPPISTSLLIALTFPFFALQIKLPSAPFTRQNLFFLMGMSLFYGYVAFRSWDCGFSIILTVLMSMFIVFVFYCTAVEEQGCLFPYQTLFNEAWKTVLKLLLGALFTISLFYLFIFSSILFYTIDITSIAKLVYSSEFFLIMPSVFFGTATTALDQYETLLVKLRDILLAFCKFLYPVVLVISLSFLLSAPFVTKIPSKFWFMIMLIDFFNIVLFNGVFQAGLSRPLYAKWFLPFIAVTFILLAAYSLYALKFFAFLMIQGSISIHTSLPLMTIAILTLYTMAYSVVWFIKQPPWLSMMKPMNTILALITAAVYFAEVIFIPCYADVVQISSPRGVVISPTLQTSTNCYLACYSNQKEQALYAINDHIYVMGEVSVPGSYVGGICIPKGYQGKDISKEAFFGALCAEKIAGCKQSHCWAGGDTLGAK